MATRLLSSEDIYDVYGLEWVLQAKDKIDQEDNQIISFRLGEIKDAYVHAAKSRIRAEAKFLGVPIDVEMSFSTILGLVKERLGKALQEDMYANADHMARGGSFNLMGTILKAHQSAGSLPKGVDLSKFGVKEQEPEKRPDVDPNWFMKGGGSKRVFDDPKWAEIAKAFMAVEAATSNLEIIISIDRLNQLQHNSFHVLIDLQTGRMLTDYSNQSDDRDARKRLQEVLDLKLNAKSPQAFASEMSNDVQKLLKKYRGVTIQVQ